MDDLIERVAGLTGPSKEVDARILCALFAPADAYVEQSEINGNWCIYNGEYNGRPRLFDKPYSLPQDIWRGAFTGSLDAAVALVERMLPGKAWCVSGHGEAVIDEPIEAATPAIALVAALLSALRDRSAQ